MSPDARIPEVDVRALPAEPVVLDVRQDEEWAAGHIEGATHIPLADLPARFADLPEAETLYVVCRSGGRSARATVWLTSQGIQAVNIEGGMMSWAAVGKPMVSTSGQAPDVLCPVPQPPLRRP